MSTSEQGVDNASPGWQILLLINTVGIEHSITQARMQIDLIDSYPQLPATGID